MKVFEITIGYMTIRLTVNLGEHTIRRRRYRREIKRVAHVRGSQAAKLRARR